MTRPGGFFDHLVSKKQELQKELESPDIWGDQTKAAELNKKLTQITGRLDELDQAKTLLEEADVLIEFAKEGESSDTEFIQELERAEDKLRSIELKNLLSEKNDNNNAFLSFSAGAGGVDAQDWTEMLIRMYTRWAQTKGFKVTVTDRSVGDEAGIKSATLYIEGDWAYGFLKGEKGVHRLVRISPFDANHRRHTSFSYVEVLPELPPTEAVKINPQDLRIDTFNASGHGGQNVQKNDTAVRVTHIPTGIAVACQNERSQIMNKTMAMKVLQSRLQELEDAKQHEIEREMRGPRVSIEWGNQIRSYVLQPYTLVKDNRTSVEIGNAQKVLEGDLDDLIWGYLKWQAKKEVS
ncbi:MAG TPA: peptide chain release factor 2 [Caldisericia bacterium]|nr:peptide chain release factor 2 [Caldisericia bacterium]HPF48084.1 peptide chain release factor 2 [Caldisericia bacterium]HPI83979.1 peptide chain release factor 2 [Caldisericia bacterium]HPQ92537.1 peptide chain release factor 2 [Caldisericia bacterium]HRV74365.1 peptide chain release factor 2 [Caldisericia bacterium]